MNDQVPAPASSSALGGFGDSPRARDDRLLDAGEVAARLAVPERWVREHTRCGLIPCLHLGRYVRYRWAAVEAWLDEQESGGAAWRKHKPVRTRSTK